jgi:hypothetical protein
VSSQHPEPAVCEDGVVRPTVRQVFGAVSGRVHPMGWEDFQAASAGAIADVQDRDGTGDR